MVPVSPKHWRRPSSASSSSKSHSRRNSLYSPASNRSSRTFTGDDLALSPRNSHDFGSSLRASGDNALDSLADELASAWEEEETFTEEAEDVDASQLGAGVMQQKETQDTPVKFDPDRIRDSGIDVGSPPRERSSHKRQGSRSHRSTRHPRGQPSNAPEHQGVDEYPRSLQLCMKEIEDLAKQGAESDDAIPEEDGKDAFQRLSTSLKELGGPQAGFESYTTRLITAHTSLSTHVAHQSRSLHSLTYFFLSPLPSQPLYSEEQIDELLPMLSRTIETLPQPTLDALSGLNRLFTTSKDAIGALSSLSDNLHMSREGTTTAARKLRSTKDMVSELRKELRESEDGASYVEDGHWNRRLSGRESARTCKDVVSGFEDVCESWRKRLLNGRSAEAGLA